MLIDLTYTRSLEKCRLLKVFKLLNYYLTNVYIIIIYSQGANAKRYKECGKSYKCSGN